MFQVSVLKRPIYTALLLMSCAGYADMSAFNEIEMVDLTGRAFKPALCANDFILTAQEDVEAVSSTGAAPVEAEGVSKADPDANSSVLKSLQKVAQPICAFTSAALLTEPLTNRILDGVESAVYTMTQSAWVAKFARVGAFDSVYNYSRDTAALVGYELPALVAKASAIYKDPYKSFEVAGDMAKVALKTVTVQGASYLLTQPINEGVSSATYYGTLLLTSNPVLAQCVYTASKGALHYTNAGNLAAKYIGYQSVDFVASAVGSVASYASSWWYSSAAK